MPSLVALALLALAVAQVTWLIVDAAITLPIRQWVVNRFGAEGKLAYLVHCPGCTATWVSLILTPVTFWTPHIIWTGFLAVLAMARLGPMLMSIADRIEVGGD